MNKYTQLSPEVLQNHLDGFLIEHWSVSAVSEFIRNEKSFEKKYVFKDYDSQSGVSAIMGRVYHEALMGFFQEFKGGRKMGFDELSILAHSILDQVADNEYAPQKNKTLEQLKAQALKGLNAGINNFLGEFDSYEAEIEEILFIEPTFKEFVTINDIDVPLPLKVKIDLVFINKRGELCILDHKLKSMYTQEEAVDERYSKQSICYCLALDEAILRFPDVIAKWPKAKEGVENFYFYENKHTQNRDGSRQIRQIPIDMGIKSSLYKQILFEGVFKLMQAVQDPDYVYLMNTDDVFQKGSELLEFWIKTHIEGLDGFPNLTPQQKAILKRRKTLIRRSALVGIPKSIIKSFKEPKDFVALTPKDMENLTNEERIEHRLRTFNYSARVEHTIDGYSCDTYLLQIGAGNKISSMARYRLDLANVLGVRDVRIPNELVEYQGEAFASIEVNRKQQRTLIFNARENNLSGNTFPVGKTNFGETISWSLDNPSTPHMMISGASGSGKSVVIRTIIEVAASKGIKVAILDPKYEFVDMKEQGYEVYNESADIEAYMMCKVDEMDSIFKTSGARGQSANKQLIIFDEAADCLSRKKEYGTLEKNTLLLAQKARSAGIHLLLAAQRFSVKILTGDAKANFPTRLCLTVASAIDSKVMLGVEGAEKLNGRGDGLFISPDRGEPVRIQCFATEKALT